MFVWSTRNCSQIPLELNSTILEVHSGQCGQRNIEGEENREIKCVWSINCAVRPGLTYSYNKKQFPKSPLLTLFPLLSPHRHNNNITVNTTEYTASTTNLEIFQFVISCLLYGHFQASVQWQRIQATLILSLMTAGSGPVRNQFVIWTLWDYIHFLAWMVRVKGSARSMQL